MDLEPINVGGETVRPTPPTVLGIAGAGGPDCAGEITIGILRFQARVTAREGEYRFRETTFLRVGNRSLGIDGGAKQFGQGRSGESFIVAGA